MYFFFKCEQILDFLSAVSSIKTNSAGYIFVFPVVVTFNKHVLAIKTHFIIMQLHSKTITIKRGTTTPFTI